ncbi:MAG: radical SAM protein [Desulfovibrionales bacterium]|nr:radical SAM protein [Desulfovibrionales bacterium]
MKEWGGRLPVALVFPEPAEHGLSTLGWQVVYRLLASREDLAVERFFWDPIPPRPRSVDSGRDLGLFPLVAFSLNFEGDFPAVLRMLGDAGIALKAEDRPEWPLVLAGGPLTFLNPFPVLPALDCLFVGEAEAGLSAMVDRVAAAWIKGEEKATALDAIAHLPGVLVPGKSRLPVRRQVCVEGDLILRNPGFSCFVSSEAQFRDMLLLEVNRGCPYGCRFCAAGSIYKPPRHAEMARLQEVVRLCAPHKVGLVGTALTDWPDLLPFLRWLEERKIKFSLSSLRADGLDDELLEFLRRTGTRSVTLALEGASARLRSAMNKHFSEEAFLDAVRRISRLQFNTLKLYMITGWPDEKEEDWVEFEEFLGQIDEARRQGQGMRRKGVDLISLSASCLVPKAWTPLQWAGVHDEDWIRRAMKRLKTAAARFRGMRFTGENPGQAQVQAFLARSGEEIFPFLERAAQVGLAAASRECAATIREALAKNPDKDTVFPWERLDVGVSRKFLYAEWKKYGHALLTPPCPDSGCQGCRLCGMDAFLAGSPR